MQIRLRNLKRNYASLHAVDDVSLDIPSNTVYGIIGRSGAGKSTLVRLVSMLEKPDQGEVYYDDKRVDNLSKDELIQERRKIGMIFQNFNLFASRNAEENIAYPMEICHMDKAYIKKRTAELLALVGLEGRGSAPISTLSGGQKQRLCIARTLLKNPKILIFDDSTSAVDTATEGKIRRALAARKDVTKLIIAQRVTSVMEADKIVILEDGTIHAVGTHQELLDRDPIYQEIYYSQMREEDEHGPNR